MFVHIICYTLKEEHDYVPQGEPNEKCSKLRIVFLKEGIERCLRVQRRFGQFFLFRVDLSNLNGVPCVQSNDTARCVM